MQNSLRSMRNALKRMDKRADVEIRLRVREVANKRRQNGIRTTAADYAKIEGEVIREMFAELEGGMSGEERPQESSRPSEHPVNKISSLQWVMIAVGIFIGFIFLLSFVDTGSEGSDGGGSTPSRDSSDNSTDDRVEVAPTPKPTPTPRPFRMMVEECLSPWDGNHEGFEAQIRPLLNNEGSMQTHSTRFGVEPGPDGRSLIQMEYSAENIFGGRVKTIAWGQLDPNNCEVEVIESGVEY